MAGIWITKRVAKILSSSSDRCHQSFLWFSKNMNFADFGGTQKHGWLWTSSQRLLGTTTKAYGQTVVESHATGRGKGLQLTWCLDSSGRLLTIFSASRYAGRFSNSGGVAVLHHGTGPTEASLSLRFLGRDWTWWVQMTSFFRTMPLVNKKKKFFFCLFPTTAPAIYCHVPTKASNRVGRWGLTRVCSCTALSMTCLNHIHMWRNRPLVALPDLMLAQSRRADDRL